MNIDIFRDLGLNNTIKNNSNAKTENIICEYKIDANSSGIKKGELVSFFNNYIKKCGKDDIANAIALSSGNADESIKCQITGIVKLEGLVAGTVYYNENGTLSINKTDKMIGKALDNEELLLINGVFINV
ncbi:hypothetical protein FDA77_00830 [Clostridium botulinum]|nr:hypothetical protein [Clostridium botulinum]NFJ88493.1 hypothetical protein [Clostridium botulinum]HDI3121691.1 hypothetical protein [Clostridium botulinum]